MGISLHASGKKFALKVELDEGMPEDRLLAPNDAEFSEIVGALLSVGGAERRKRHAISLAKRLIRAARLELYRWRTGTAENGVGIRLRIQDFIGNGFVDAKAAEKYFEIKD